MLRRLSPRIVVGALYLIVALAFLWPLPLHMGTAFTGDPGGDTGVYVWNQWVFQHETGARHNPLKTDQILSLSAPADLTQHNYTAFLNLLALPLLPWLGVVWWGMAAGRWLLERRRAGIAGAIPAAARPLAALGRWSLSFYMLHQPVLIGAIMAVLALRR